MRSAKYFYLTAIAVMLLASACPGPRVREFVRAQGAYNEGYYGVSAHGRFAEFIACEHEYFDKYGKLGDLDELIAKTSLTGISPEHIDAKEIKYQVTVAADGKSLDLRADWKTFTWHKHVDWPPGSASSAPNP